MSVDKPHNILVIKFCCLGDLVFLTPTLRGLREAYPHSSISLLISSWVEELIPCIPSVDAFIVSDAPYEKSRRRQILGAFNLLSNVRASRPEIAFVGHRNSLFGMLAYFSGAKHRLGFTGTRFLTHTTEFNSSVHEVDRYIAILKSFGIHVHKNETQICAPEADRMTLDKKLVAEGVQPQEPLVVIFPGGGENPGMTMTIKRWLPDRYRELITRIRAQYTFPVVLIGGPNEIALCDEIASHVDGVTNAAGKLTLRETIAIGHRCKLFVGGDSGPTHLVAATGSPTITLFGPSDPRLVAPRGKHHRFLWMRPICSPCYTPHTVLQKNLFQGKTFVCHTGTHECMNTLTVNDVWRVVEEQLAVA